MVTNMAHFGRFRVEIGQKMKKLKVLQKILKIKNLLKKLIFWSKNHLSDRKFFFPLFRLNFQNGLIYSIFSLNSRSMSYLWAESTMLYTGQKPR